MTSIPTQSRLFQDFSAGKLHAWLPAGAPDQPRPALPAHWPELVRLVAEQNPSPSTQQSLAALTAGAGAILTGQQVGLFGGPLFSPFKAATAIARARHSTSLGQPHVAIFWLATEDHDFAEVAEAVLPANRELVKLAYENAPTVAQPAGRILFSDSIATLAAHAAELLGPSEAADALVAAYRPGRTFAQAFADFYSRVFAAQGLLIVDAAGRGFHRLGAPVLRAAIEQADDLSQALIERSQALEAAGYHAQVAVTPQPTLLFLIDQATGARLALRRIPPSAQEPHGLWRAESLTLSTNELLAILSAEPERISPAALLRPVFQDFLFGTSAQVGGPAEIAYLAQSSVLFERILGRQTPPLARFSATLIEPHVAKLLHKHELTLGQIFAEEHSAALAQTLAARSMPPETRQRLDATGAALDAELDTLVAWLQAQDKGLGQSAETAAGKMRYQMGRLRTLAANFQLQREATLSRHAETLFQSIFPGGVLQERVHAGAYYFARYGLDLAETLCANAAQHPSAHTALWL